jgi:electron transfer flavoprotein alpha subunit
MSILVVMEQRGGEWNRMSFEALAAAQQIARETDTTASAAVLGNGMDALAGDGRPAIGESLCRGAPAAGGVHRGWLHRCVGQLVAQASPALVLFPHTYQVRDFLPKLATSLGKVAVSDVVGHRIVAGHPNESGQLVLVRQLFQGKVNVDVRFAGEAPHFASLQAGAWRADQAAGRAAGEGSARWRSSRRGFRPATQDQTAGAFSRVGARHGFGCGS